MLYFVTILTVALAMLLGDIGLMSPTGLIALGVGLSLAITFRNQRRRRKDR